MGQEIAIQQQPQFPAFSLSDMERIATAIAKGGMFGSKDPYAVLTLCMLAQAEGQHPAVVFRDYDLIQGKPAKKAEAMLRDFMGSGGKVTWNRLDDECADATFSHPQGGTVTINWTMARAQKAQLGGKDMWKKYPRQMLRSRVVSEGVRTVCPNATSGLYVPEEVRDFAPDSTPSDTPATPEPKRARDLKREEPKQIEADPGRAKAEAWVDGFTGALGETDVEGARELFAKSANAIAKLQREHPDLHEKVEALRPSEERQPGLLDEPTAAQTKAADLLTALDTAKDAKAVDAAVAEYEKHKDALDEEDQVAVEIAISQARARFETAGAK